MPAAAVPLTKTIVDAPGARRSQPIEREYLNEFEVSMLTGISISTLRKDRSERVGMPYVSMPRCIRYAIQDVRAYMDAHKINAGDRAFNPESKIGRPRKDGSKPDAATGCAAGFVAARQKAR